MGNTKTARQDNCQQYKGAIIAQTRSVLLESQAILFYQFTARPVNSYTTSIFNLQPSTPPHTSAHRIPQNRKSGKVYRRYHCLS